MIVGPGWVAEEHIKAFASHAHCQLRAIAGVIPTDEARARGYIETYNLEGCVYTDDYEKALERDDIDIVSVCTINSLHFPNAQRALEAGKHVFVEKPLVLSPEQLSELRQLVSKTGVHTFVGHVSRYYPAIAAAGRFIDAGLIGRVYYAECHYYHEIAAGWKSRKETGGSSLLMAGCHAVDMVWWLMGEKEPREVFAYSQPSLRRPDFEYDPTITAVVKFEDGTLGQFASSLDCNMPYVFHLQAMGEHGTVRNDGLYSVKICPDAQGFMAIPATYPDHWDVAHHPFVEEIHDFVDGILEGKRRDLCIEKAGRVYDIIFAAEKSAAIGQPVKV
jgi:predicted dehydrogenase